MSNTYIDPNRFKSQSGRPKPTAWSAPEATASPQIGTGGGFSLDSYAQANGYAKPQMQSAGYRQAGQYGQRAGAGPAAGGYGQQAAGGYGQQAGARTAGQGAYGNTINTMYNGYNQQQTAGGYQTPGRYGQQPVQAAGGYGQQNYGQQASIYQQHYGQNSYATQPPPTQSTVNQSNVQFNALLAAFGETVVKTTKATTTTTTTTTASIITLPMFNFGTAKPTTAKVITPKVSLKMGTSDGQAADTAPDTSATAGGQFTPEMMKQMVQMMMSGSYNFQQPMIPSATYGSATAAQPAAPAPPAPPAPAWQAPTPDPVNGLTGAALEAAKGRYSTHTGHYNNMARASNMAYQGTNVPAGRMQGMQAMGGRPMAASGGGRGPMVAKRPYAAAKRPLYGAGKYGKRPTIRTTTMAPTTSTYSPHDCGRDDAGLLWCAGTRIYEKKEKPKKPKINTYGKVQLSKFAKNAKFAKPKAPVKQGWTPPQPNLGIKNRTGFEIDRSGFGWFYLNRSMICDRSSIQDRSGFEIVRIRGRTRMKV